jgi:hypothetical protein
LDGARTSSEAKITLIAGARARLDAEFVKIFMRSKADEAAHWVQIHRHWLPLGQQIMDILKCSPAIPVPKHKAIGGVLGHLGVLHGIEIETSGTPGCIYGANLPMSDIVAGHSGHGVDHHSLVSSVRQVLLERAVGAIGISHDHRKTSVHKIIKLRPNGLVQASDPPRSTEENSLHD